MPLSQPVASRYDGASAAHSPVGIDPGTSPWCRYELAVIQPGVVFKPVELREQLSVHPVDLTDDSRVATLHDAGVGAQVDHPVPGQRHMHTAIFRSRHEMMIHFTPAQSAVDKYPITHNDHS